MKMLQSKSAAQVPKLNEAMAIELGANILGEAILFCTAGGLVFVEYNRQVSNNEQKEIAKKAEFDSMQQEIERLNSTIKHQDDIITDLNQVVGAIGRRVRFIPTLSLMPVPEALMRPVTPSKSTENESKASSEANADVSNESMEPSSTQKNKDTAQKLDSNVSHEKELDSRIHDNAIHSALEYLKDILKL